MKQNEILNKRRQEKDMENFKADNIAEKRSRSGVT